MSIFVLININMVSYNILLYEVHKAAIKAASPNAPKAPECAIAVCIAPASEEAVAAVVPLFVLPEL
jgi:hypothetical protein